jgi:hypothetical protein
MMCVLTFQRNILPPSSVRLNPDYAEVSASMQTRLNHPEDEGSTFLWNAGRLHSLCDV